MYICLHQMWQARVALGSQSHLQSAVQETVAQLGVDGKCSCRGASFQLQIDIHSLL